jgi:hypothetical protein
VQAAATTGRTSGPLDDGGGFDINGGVNYEFWRGTALGIFARYDQLSVDSTPTDDDTKFMTTASRCATASCLSHRRPRAGAPPVAAGRRR